MKNILLPTDFSKNSINAIDYAVQFLKNTSCNFYILNVQKTSTFISDDMMTVASSSTIYNTIIDAARKSIANIISIMENTYSNKKHRFHAMVDYDNFIDSINQTSKLHNIDFIIMGTKGVSGLSKFIFGSNAIRVIERTDVPVLAIPEGCQFIKANKVALITNNVSRKDINKINPLKDLLESYDTIVTGLYLKSESVISETEKKPEFLEALLKKINYDELDVVEKDLFSETKKYLLDNDFQMLALLSEKHSFLERLFHTDTVETFGFSIKLPFFVMKKL
ncbi:MAG: universal stress protein [Algibacter sp.]